MSKYIDTCYPFYLTFASEICHSAPTKGVEMNKLKMEIWTLSRSKAQKGQALESEQGSSAAPDHHGSDS